jgi:FkbM family methyltransferase
MLDKINLFKKKKFEEYSYKVSSFQMREGTIDYAHWLHPGEANTIVHQKHLDFFAHFIKKGDLTIDIGAHQGDTTVPMAIAAGTNGLTLGLEPNPHVHKVLVANSKLNRAKTNIVPLNFAATAYDGKFTFGSGDPSYGNGGIVGFTSNEKRNVRYTFDVEGRNLEHLLEKEYASWISKLSFIKVDTEGYDKEILKSLSTIIDKQKPYLVAECFGPAKPNEKLELFDLLNDFNYLAYEIDDFDLASRIELRRENAVKKKTYNILAIPRSKPLLAAL